MTGLSDALAAPRQFELHRYRDVSGVSGTGVVAVGTQFPDPADVVFPDGLVLALPAGWCRVTWMTGTRSTALWSSTRDALTVHGHDGATRLVWV